MSTIDGQTKIQFYAVACSLPVVVSAVLWISSIDAKASEAKAASIERLEGLRRISDRLDHAMTTLISIDSRLSRIEGKLDK